MENAERSDRIGYSSSTSSSAWFQTSVVSGGSGGPVTLASADSKVTNERSEGSETRTPARLGGPSSVSPS